LPEHPVAQVMIAKNEDKLMYGYGHAQRIHQAPFGVLVNVIMSNKEMS
jgi:hypothetical protein